jgi:hypothetical protein
MRKLLGLGLVILLALNAQHSAFAQKAGDRKANKASVEKVDELAFGHGVLCNTAKQMERYLTLYRDNTTPEAAVKAVNTETESPGACGFAFVAFVPGHVAGTVNCTGGVMRMMQITVLARKTERGWVKVVPTKQFTALFDQAEEA